MDGYGKRILVIDGNAGCRALLKAQLEQEGYAVQTVCDGLAALDEMDKRRFDAVIVDSDIPGLSGLEFYEFSRMVWPETPVILLSADLNNSTEYADVYGVVACIGKPYEASMLLSVLRTATQLGSADQTTFPMTQCNRNRPPEPRRPFVRPAP